MLGAVGSHARRWLQDLSDSGPFGWKSYSDRLHSQQKGALLRVPARVVLKRIKDTRRLTVGRVSPPGDQPCFLKNLVTLCVRYPPPAMPAMKLHAATLRTA